MRVVVVVVLEPLADDPLGPEVVGQLVQVDREMYESVTGEEAPARIRTATTNGIIMLTFTPLAGMSEVVMGFLPAEMQIHDGA